MNDIADLNSALNSIVDRFGMPTILKGLADIAVRRETAAELSARLGLRQKPGTQRAIIEWALLRPEGVTLPEMLKMLGWPSISFPQEARNLGLVLTKRKEGRGFRYFARRLS